MRSTITSGFASVLGHGESGVIENGGRFSKVFPGLTVGRAERIVEKMKPRNKAFADYCTVAERQYDVMGTVVTMGTGNHNH